MEASRSIFVILVLFFKCKIIKANARIWGLNNDRRWRWSCKHEANFNSKSMYFSSEIFSSSSLPDESNLTNDNAKHHTIVDERRIVEEIFLRLVENRHTNRISSKSIVPSGEVYWMNNSYSNQWQIPMWWRSYHLLYISLWYKQPTAKHSKNFGRNFKYIDKIFPGKDWTKSSV